MKLIHILIITSVLLLLLCDGANSAYLGTSLGRNDLTELCCTTEVSTRMSDHAIDASTNDRKLVRLYKTSAYMQVTVESYCMSLTDTTLHITVHPRCAGACRQVKEAQDVIVIDEHGNRTIKQVLVNSGCVFVPS